MNIGDRVPDFEAIDQHGQTVSLSGLLKNGPVVLFFYPKAMTAGCTKESCHFRDLRSEFEAAGAQPIGISFDPPDKQKKFDDMHNLGFTLLSDTDKKIAKLMGAKRAGPLPPSRATFVIDNDGTVLHVTRTELNMDAHADEALEVLRRR